jgi:hypothetical protein
LRERNERKKMLKDHAPRKKEARTLLGSSRTSIPKDTIRRNP